MVRRRVVRLRHADLRVGAATVLAADHEADDAGQVGLVGQHLQVEHQLRVLVEGGGNPQRRRDLRQLLIDLRLGLLDAALDVAHRLEVFAELQPVARPQIAAQRGHLVRHRIEKASVLLDAREPRGGIRSPGVAQQALEDRPRIGLHRQRRRRTHPADRVGVCAGVSATASAHIVARLESQLQRRELRMPAGFPRHLLVHRHAGPELGALRALRRHTGQEAGGARLVDVVRPLVAESRHDEQAVAEWLQGLQDRSDLEPRARRRGNPLLHHDAVGDVDDAQPPHRLRGSPAEGGQRRHHAVEQRQRERGADAAEYRAARESLPADHHDSDLRI